MGITINGQVLRRDSFLSDGTFAKVLPQEGLILHIDSEHKDCVPGVQTLNQTPYNTPSQMVYDLSGRGNHFQYYVSGVPTSVTLADNRFFQFNGSNQYLGIANDILPTDTPYTLLAWVFPINLASQDNSFPLYNTYGSSSSMGFWHHYNSNGDILYRTYGSTHGYVSGTLSGGHGLTNGSWQMTAVTWGNNGTSNQSYLRGYKNGELTNQVQLDNGHLNSGSRGGRIGMLNYRNTSSDYNYNGYIGLHLIYQRELSEDEIRSIYNLYRERYNV